MIIGVIGLGTVGFGTVDILTKEKDRLERETGEDIVVKYGCALENPGLPDGVIYTTDFHDVINDDEVDVVVELIGGTTFAKTIIMEAIKRHKHVVTANKALLAHHGEEIFTAANEAGVNVFYEAAVGGGIPVVVPARESLIANNILKIEGILNGTTNFILTLMEKDNLDFEDALAIAQNLGYVEADASLDLDGYDAAHKIHILTMNAWQVFFDFDKISCTGIRDVTKQDMDIAAKLGYRIKLVAKSEKQDDGSIGIDVSPTLVPKADIMGNVMDAYNVVEITSDYVENVLFYGKGAGRYVTASAVVSDIIKCAGKTLWRHDYTHTDNVRPLTRSRFYVRSDRPLDLNYDEYMMLGGLHVYITDVMERADLDKVLANASTAVFKIRDEKEV